MDWIKRITLYCCMFLFVCSLMPTLILAPAEKIIFQAKSYQEALEAQHFYEKVPGWITQYVFEQTGLAGEYQGNTILAGLNPGGLENIIRRLFPPEILKQQGDLLIQQITDYLNFRSSSLEIYLDLLEFKSRMTGEGQELIIREIIYSWPVCTPEQLITIAGCVLTGRINDAPFCLPPDEYLSFFEEIISQAVAQVFGSLPDRVTILASDTGEQWMQPEQAAGWKILWGFYRTVRGGLFLSPFVSLFGFTALVVLNIRSREEIFRWLGRSFLTTGTLVFLGCFVGILTAGFFGALMTGQLAPAASGEVFSAFTGMFRYVFIRFFAWSGLMGLAAGASGASLLLAAGYRFR